MSLKNEIEDSLGGQHPDFGARVELLIMVLVLVSVVSVGIETWPGLPDWLTGLLTITEVVIVILFTIELAVRIAVTPVKWSYLLSFHGIIDIVAIAPFYLGLAFVGIGVDLRAVRALRLLRLFRLLKLKRYQLAVERLAGAWRSVREEIIVYAVASAAVLYCCALVIYYCEADAQPDAYSSVLDAIWWAAITLTTVGYGDIYPVTALGRFFTVLMLFIGLGFIAVPTGLIASALTAIRGEERANAKRQ